MFEVDQDVNNNAAIEVHIVIIYEEKSQDNKIGLTHSLKNTDSTKYFSKDFVDQLKKDNPNRLVIYKFTFAAEARITNWEEVKYENDHMVPVCGLVFANYSCGSNAGGNSQNNSGSTSNSANCYRAEIPSECKKMKIILHKSNFTLKYREEDPDEDEEEEVRRLRAEKMQEMGKKEKSKNNDTKNQSDNNAKSKNDEKAKDNAGNPATDSAKALTSMLQN
ncbi:MAG: hypothetical protein LBT90_00600 [Holosporaceae bacterium]|nr:hypothetical protein [Holosporaceae bacterium]